MTVKKIFCEVIEGVVYSDRCLFKLCKVIEGNKTCETCILRELEKVKSSKIKGSHISTVSFDMKKERKKRKHRKRSKSIKNGAKQIYSLKELSGLLGKSERTLREWAQKGKIPAVRVGIKKWSFPKEKIDRWLSGKKGSTGVPVQPKEQQESTMPSAQVSRDSDNEQEGMGNESS